MFSIISPQYETYEFITVELMVVDEEKSLVLWESGDSDLVEALYKAVSFKVAGLESLIESVRKQQAESSVS